MRQYIPYLLVPIVVSAFYNPCQAQTTTDNTENSTNQTLTNPQPTSNTDINSSINTANKSAVSRDAVSQASGVTVAKPNPRIPIPSRIFPALQQ
ncbi:hypothetical protein NIES4071_97110 [Calothrix sp. NIES-4071]|nr:hypothetical protein NIES4071_97110 [Calothrix sp. NIES-4071]BAZ63976.1 hypothetical protein NIES4105_97040 [Calothrix sp. NIES-4105]